MFSMQKSGPRGGGGGGIIHRRRKRGGAAAPLNFRSRGLRPPKICVNGAHVVIIFASKPVVRTN